MGLKPEFTRLSLKKIKRLDPPLKERFLKAVNDILSNPQRAIPLYIVDINVGNIVLVTTELFIKSKKIKKGFYF